MENSSPESFDKIVSESKASLQSEAMAQVKNKGGRPPGSKNKKGRENEVPSQNTSPNAEPGQGSLPPGSVPLSHGEVMPMVDLEPLAKDAIKIPFSFWAMRTQEPALELTEEEGKTASFYLSRVVNLYFPEIQQKDPKTFSVYALLASLFSLFVKKSLLSMGIRKEKIKKMHAEAEANVKAAQAAGPSSPNSGPVIKPQAPEETATVSASDFLGAGPRR